MTHRFIGAIGKQFSGDRARAQELTGLARILVQQCVNEIGHRGGLGQAYRIKQLPDGSTIHVTVIQNLKGIAPIVRTQLFAPKGVAPSITTTLYEWLATAWLPEGLVITPRTADAPHGWGFPKRDALTGERINPPFGTVIASAEDESCNQVLINRYENNKYLDHPLFIAGLPDGLKLPDNPRLRNTIEDPVPENGLGFYVHWPTIFAPLDYTRVEDSFNVWATFSGKAFDDAPGMRVGAVPYQPQGNIYQFNANGTSILYEPEAGEWFAHWPEELLYDNHASEAVFQKTNQFRAKVGRQPLSRAIRGWIDPGVLTISEVFLSKTMAHENDTLFRPGRASWLDRWSTFLPLTRENQLISSSGSPTSKQSGELFADLWEGSPDHYSAMIDPYWDNPRGHLAVALRSDVVVDHIHRTNDDAPGKEVAISGVLAVGTHYAPVIPLGTSPGELDAGVAGGWVAAGLLSNLTQFGIVSWSHYLPGCFATPLAIQTYFLADRIYYQNRQFAISVPETEEADEGVCTVVGATIVDLEGFLWIRAVVRVSVTVGSNKSIEHRCLRTPVGATEGDINEIPHRWETESTLSIEPFGDEVAALGASSPCVFLNNGREGRFVYPVLREANKGTNSCKKDEHLDATPLFWTLAEIGVVNGVLAVRREIIGPEIKTRLKFSRQQLENQQLENPKSCLYTLEEVEQTCVGEVDIFPLVRGNKFVYARYEFDMSIIQKKMDPIMARRNEWLHLPGLDPVQTVAFEVDAGEASDLSFVALDHVDLHGGDLAYRRVSITRVSDSEAKATVELIVNGKTTAQYATDGYYLDINAAINRGKGDISKLAFSFTLSGDCVDEKDPPPLGDQTHLGSVMFFAFNHASVLNDGSFSFDLAETPGIVCSENQFVKYNLGRFPTGMHAGLLFGHTDNLPCLPVIKDGKKYIAANLTSCLAFDHSGSQFCRYKDAFVGAQVFRGFMDIKPENDDEDVYVVQSGVSLSDLLGIECTDVRPLGLL